MICAFNQINNQRLLFFWHWWKLKREYNRACAFEKFKSYRILWIFVNVS